MIHEHNILFRLDTPNEDIDAVLATAAEVGIPVNTEQEKWRGRVRGLGNGIFRALRFDIIAPEGVAEKLKDRLWAEHPKIISLTVTPRITRGPKGSAASARDAVIHMFDTQPGDKPVVRLPLRLRTIEGGVKNQ